MKKTLLMATLWMGLWLAPAQAQFLPPNINLPSGTANPRAKVLLQDAAKTRDQSLQNSGSKSSSSKQAPQAQAPPKKPSTDGNMTAPQKVDTWSSGKSLHQAVAAGNITEVEQMVKAGASLKGRDKDGNTPLHVAAAKGQVDMLKYLMAQPDVDVNVQESRGSTALMLAATNGNGPVIAALLEKGADLKVASNDGSTALHRAAAAGWAEVVDQLLAAGADPQAVDKKGRTPMEVAEKNRQRDWSMVVDKLKRATPKT